MSWYQEVDLKDSLNALRDLLQGRAYIIGNSECYLQKSLLSHLGRILPQYTYRQPNYSSWDCPVNPKHTYLITGTPAATIADALLEKNIPKPQIIHADRLIAINPDHALNSLETMDIWYECYPTKSEDIIFNLLLYNQANAIPERYIFWLNKLLEISPTPVQSLGKAIIQLAQTPDFLKTSRVLEKVLFLADTQIKFLAKNIDAIPLKPILLYPSAGRCGGNSIHYALKNAIPMPLKGGHEANHQELYELLQLQLSNCKTKLLTKIALYYLLKTEDALGGNPFCFLLDEIFSLPGFNITLLHILRNTNDHIESIIKRNFHYSSSDTVPHRVSAVDYGEMTCSTWHKLTRLEKVNWYLKKVESCIQKHNTYKNYINFDIDQIEQGLNVALKLSYPNSKTSIQHLNTPPTYRIFSKQEMEILYKAFQSQELQFISRSKIEEVLKSKI